MRCGRAIAEVLAREGVDVVFGIPGVHTLEYYRGFAEAGTRTVLARHEGGAAFMADGYARAAGRPAACCVITGPGVTNAATGIGQARSDSVPMVVLASVTPSASLGAGHGLLHELPEQLAILRQVADPARRGATPLGAAQALRDVIGELRSGRLRPVAVEIPTDVLAGSLDADDAGALFGNVQAAGAPLPAPRPDQVAVVLRLLREAQAPALLVGGGAVGDAEAVVALAERLALPVVTTVAGKGIVPEGHPLLAGALLSRRAGRDWLAARDALLVLGSELSETDTAVARLDLPATLVRVDADPVVLAGPSPATVAAHADAGAFARALSATAGGGDAASAPAATGGDMQAATGDRGAAGGDMQAAGGDRGAAGGGRQAADREPAPAGSDSHAALRASREADVAALREEAMAPSGAVERALVPVLDALADRLGPDARVYADMTQAAYVGCWRWPASAPRRFLFPAGFGSLGYALPAAIGGAVADPAARTVALAGDSGFQYTMQELMTATELDLALTVVLWDNDALGQIRDDMVAGGIEPTSVIQRNPDFELLARASGFAYARPETLAEVQAVAAQPPAPRTLLHLRAAAFAA